jgi:SAM-dependent methyltransferase
MGRDGASNADGHRTEVKQLNYFITAALLKGASSSALTRRTYHALTRLKRGARNAFPEIGCWLLRDLPAGRQRILDLGTGWAHAYSLYLALLRDDDIHCFDVEDNRNWESFRATLRVVQSEITERGMLTDEQDQLRCARKCADALEAKDFAEAYKVLGITYQCTGSVHPVYPADHFDFIFSIDVLEHVDAAAFPAAAAGWFRMLKPGGLFVSQVGLDDHLAFYQGKLGSKRYLRYSHYTWEWLLGNDVQYINRLTASEIVTLLRNTGFLVSEIETDDSGDTAPGQVHPDYRNQSEADIRAVRLMVRAHKRQSTGSP